ncbi:MAG: hypothetical protein P8J89_04915 [Phycisphaerales bacterium]|nr:hypothetical protein [Phycisphaerales bacterium]
MPTFIPFILIAACLGLQMPSPSQTPTPATQAPVVLPLSRSLVARYINAIGGRVAIWDLESFTAHATIGIEGSDTKGELNLAFRNSGLMSIQLDLGALGKSQVGCNGEFAWEVTTTNSGERFEELIDPKEARERRRSLNWFELAIQINADTKSMKTIGPADFDGHPCWEVQKINRRGQEERIFIDRNSYLLRGIQIFDESNADQLDLTMSFRDWKRVKPLVLFHEIVISSMNTEMKVVFDSISLNKAPPDLFLPPDSIVSLIDSLKQQESPTVEKP